MKLLSIDASTKSLAYAMFEDGHLIAYGQFFYDGENIYKRCTDAMIKTEAMLGDLTADYVVLERAVMVRSTSVALNMAKSFGAIIAVLGKTGATICEVEPIAWQSYLGNPVIRGNEKKKLIAQHTELKTKSQIDKFVREYRKGKTMKWVEDKFGVSADTDDVSDAIGLGAFAYQKLIGEVHSKD